jgi:hypothetical protein
MPFDSTDELTLVLTVTEWNQIISQLHEAPYRIAAPIVAKISVQAAKHEQAQVEAAQRQQQMQNDAMVVRDPEAYVNGGLAGAALVGDTVGSIGFTPSE